MTQLKLTIALSHYDRHIPFIDGTVQPARGLTSKCWSQGNPAR